MKRVIDLDSWNRKEHFLFFLNFDDPYWGITTNVDFSSVYRQAKEDGESFFLYSLHKIMQAVNEIEEFRYRIEEGKVVCYDKIDVTSTIGREDGTFGFGFFTFYPDRKLFVAEARKEIERVQSLSGLCVDENDNRTDLVYFSPVPWFSFTEMKHACSFRTLMSGSKISTGKLIRENGKYLLPVSITVHHSLLDGRHVALLVDKLNDNGR